MWNLTWFDRLAADLRYAARSLRNNPSFAAVVILTAALGIGANTSIFSVVYAVLLRPLPYRDAARLVAPTNASPDAVLNWGIPDFQYAVWRDQAAIFEGIAASGPRQFTITGTGEPQQLKAQLVTPGFPGRIRSLSHPRPRFHRYRRRPPRRSGRPPQPRSLDTPLRRRSVHPFEIHDPRREAILRRRCPTPGFRISRRLRCQPPPRRHRAQSAGGRPHLLLQRRRAPQARRVTAARRLRSRPAQRTSRIHLPGQVQPRASRYPNARLQPAGPSRRQRRPCCSCSPELSRWSC